MNPAKTKYSIISTRQKIANSAKQSLDLTVDGMKLTKVESERVLGVYIDGHLTWKEHIDTLRRKLLQRIAILARARNVAFLMLCQDDLPKWCPHNPSAEAPGH